MRPALSAAATLLVGAIPRAPDASVSPDVLAKLPAVPISAFNKGTITIPMMPAEADSLTLFLPEQPGTYTFYCAPHYDKVSVQGMHGTLVVEP